MQRVNRLLMLRARNLAGPFFQRVGVNTYARSSGNFIVSRPFDPFTGPFPVVALPFEETASIEGTGESANTIIPAFTRASTATVVDHLGVVHSCLSGEARFQGAERTLTGDSAYYGANVPGVQYIPKPGCGLLIEPEATNTVPNSEDVSAWSASGVAVLEATETNPTGNVGNVYSLSEAGSAAHDIIGAVTVGDIRPFSVFVKDNGSGAINIRGAKGTTAETGVVFTIATETFSSVGTLVEDYGFEALADGWYRVRVHSDHNSAGNAAIQLTWVAGSVLFWGAQYEDSPAMTSYIPTAGAAVTRLADELSYSSVDVNGECSIVWHGQWIDGLTNAGARVFGSDDSRGTGNEMRTFGTTTSYLTVEYAGGLNFSAANTTDPIAHSFRAAAVGDTHGIWLGGSRVNSTISTVQPDHSNTDIWQILSFGNNNGYGIVRNFQIFGEALSDERMLWLSTLGNTPWTEPLETAAEAATGTPVDQGPWVTATAYAVDDVVSRGGRSFIATSAHTSGATTEPAAGADWRTVWKEVQ